MLYHYTSINSLAMILSTRKIRFSRLDQVNDFLDGKSKEVIDSQKMAFVSCFTSNSIESIPLWSLYTRFSGVRIGFDEDIFGSPSGDNVYGYQYCEVDIGRGAKRSMYQIIGPISMSYAPVGSGTHLCRIIEESDSGIGYRYNTANIGNVKSSEWAFESEIRFKILSQNQSGSSTSRERISKHLSTLTIDNRLFIDVPFQDACLEKLDILLSPSMTSAEGVIVQSIIDKFAPNARVDKSQIKVRLKRF